MRGHYWTHAELEAKRVRGSSNGYLIHQLIADLFGDRDARGYLYRAETTERGTSAIILSQSEPQDQRGRPWGTIHNLASRPFEPALDRAQIVDYEIAINATRVVTDPDNGSKSRVDVWDAVFAANRDDTRSPADLYRQYLQRRLGESADLHSCRVTERGMRRLSRSGKKDSIRFVQANLIGSLTVNEPGLFLSQLSAGLGRAKAFGCGLLCLSAPGSLLPRRYPGLGSLAPSN